MICGDNYSSPIVTVDLHSVVCISFDSQSSTYFQRYSGECAIEMRESDIVLDRKRVKISSILTDWLRRWMILVIFITRETLLCMLDIERVAQ